MKIKVGDKVKILTGKDKGKVGQVLQVLVTEKKAVIEGLNLILKHQRPRKMGEKGQRIQFPAPINLSNVSLICPKCGEPARVGFKLVVPTGQTKPVKNRICHKCREVI